MNRIDSLDPLIVAVTPEEFLRVVDLYKSLGCEVQDVGDGVHLVDAGNEGVIARFRLARTN